MSTQSASSRSGDDARARRTTLAACCGIHALQDGLIATMYVLLPVLAQTFGLGYAQVGLLRALHTAAMSVLEIPAGMLAERTGERPLLVFGLACGGAGYLCLSASSGIAAVAMSLALAGLGAAFQHALSSSLITRTFSAGSPRGALGTYNSAGDVGKLAFTALFSTSVGAGIAWQQVASGFGILALTGAGLVLLVLGRAGAGAAAGHDTRLRAAGWGIRDRRAFGGLMLIVLLDIGVQSSFLTYLAFLMLDKQVPAGLAAFAVVLTLTGGILGKFACGFLADRLGMRRSLAIIQCACGAAILAVAASPPLLAFCLLPLLGVVLQGSSSITYGTVGELVDPKRHARAFGIVYSVSGLASIITPVAYGALGDRAGLTTAMAAMAATVLLTVPLSGLLRDDGHAARPAG